MKGTSNAQYSEYLNDIKLNDVQVDFSSMDLSFLESQKYEKEFMERVSKAEEVSVQDLLENKGRGKGEVRVGGSMFFPLTLKKIKKYGRITLFVFSWGGVFHSYSCF